MDPITARYLRQLETARKMQEGFGQIDSPGEMVSGHYVQSSIAPQLINALKYYQGAQMEKEAQAGLTKAEEDRKAKIAELLKGMPVERDVPQYQSGTDQMIEGAMAGDQGGAVPVPKQVGMQHVTPTEGERMAWALKMQELDPNAAQTGVRMMEMDLARKSQEQQRKDALTARREDMATRQQQMMEMAKLQASLKPEGLQMVVGPDGNPIYVPKSQAVGQQAYVKPSAGAQSATQHIQDAKESNALLDQVDKVGPMATGSLLGSLRDKSLAAIGKSTPEGEAAAQMKVLGASLTAKVPKMSGPQSDKDVAMYKEAAGNIADPNVPWEQKRAAIATIREINNRQLGYSNQGAAPTGGPKFLGFE